MKSEDIALRKFAATDLDWLVDRHRVLYAESDEFDESFGDLVAKILQDYLAGHDAVRERSWIAETGGRRVGSIFCVATAEPHVAQLRLLFLEPSARGIGLGQLLVETCIKFARMAGYRKLRLWTHDTHRAAIRLYERNGFRLTATEPVFHFGQHREQQHWELALT